MASIALLPQGDVGCGKTVVAFLALLAAAGSGYQGAMMAPTEVNSQRLSPEEKVAKLELQPT